jgi:hypothetical protein
MSTGGRSNLTRTKENQNFATRRVTCGYHKASCELLFPYGPAKFCVACKALALFVIIVVMIIIIYPLVLHSSSSAGSQNSSLTDQALLIHCSDKKFQLYGTFYYYYYYYYLGRNSSAGIGTRTDWTARGSNPGWGVILCTRPDRHWGSYSLLYD